MTIASAADWTRRYVDMLSHLQAVVGKEEMAALASRLQQFYRQDLWPNLTAVELSEQQAQWNSAMTEIHRHMRLLSVEVKFAQSATNVGTRQQRLAQIEQRLAQLQGFSQVLLTLISV